MPSSVWFGQAYNQLQYVLTLRPLLAAKYLFPPISLTVLTLTTLSSVWPQRRCVYYFSFKNKLELVPCITLNYWQITMVTKSPDFHLLWSKNGIRITRYCRLPSYGEKWCIRYSSMRVDINILDWREANMVVSIWECICLKLLCKYIYRHNGHINTLNIFHWDTENVVCDGLMDLSSE